MVINIFKFTITILCLSLEGYLIRIISSYRLLIMDKYLKCKTSPVNSPCLASVSSYSDSENNKDLSAKLAAKNMCTSGKHENTNMTISYLMSGLITWFRRRAKTTMWTLFRGAG
jgi:hypothetical protein